MPNYSITLRTDPALQFPVPTFEPAAEDSPSVIAIDIAPKGSPAPFGNHGYAWVDICDKSIIDMDTGAMPKQGFNALRLGINDHAVWVGSMQFNEVDPKPAPKPVEIIVGNVPQIKVSEAQAEFKETVTVGTPSLQPGLASKSHGIALAKSGTGYFSTDNYPTLIINRDKAGQAIQLRQNGVIVGTIVVAADGVTLTGFKQIDSLLQRVAALEAAI
ncbi:hypothetical protein [Polyangium sp. 6x1]|uniref:hypothetical protein n=1 Tax=Polyangium sp. 6x1 TaxID=3042689 RepID=UPI0024822DB3|nr:hypothetical protein [Polyangium sp. 6x1]MDI1451873.1 hypothetical protein [Polyangium sp. 6x1]